MSSICFFTAKISKTCRSSAEEVEPQRFQQSLGVQNIFGEALPAPLPLGMVQKLPFPAHPSR